MHDRSTRLTSHKEVLPDMVELLVRVDPFHLLKQQELELLAANSKLKYYPKGSYVFRQGESSHRVLYLVIRGRVEIHLEDASGEFKAGGERKPLEFFGETVFFTGESYPASTVALEELTCMLIPGDAFEKVLTNNQEMAAHFTQMLTTRMKSLYLQMGQRDNEEDFQDQFLRKRASDIMVSPAVTCLPGQDLRRAALQMKKREVSSLVVAAPNGKLVGIITHKDLVEKVLAEDTSQAPRYVFEIMTTRVNSIKTTDFAYRALLLMAKHRIKHVVVTENNRPSGIITVNDLMKSRSWGTLSAVNSIEAQQTMDDLAEAVKEVDQVQQALVAENARAREICELLTEFYDRITRKLLGIAEEEMFREGRGRPPARYCWINMGSSGRREQFARTDQDNAIIFEDLPTSKQEKDARRYFMELGRKTTRGLEQCGFKRCPGGVMAENQRWCRSLSEWYRTVKQWTEKLDPTHIRDMTIFLDFRPVYGEIELGNKLRQDVSLLFREAYPALLFLAEDDLNHRVPLNIFRQVITDRDGKINLKSAVSVHLIDCVRIFSLREGIKETSTFRRIQRLGNREVLNRDYSKNLQDAFENLLKWRINQTLHQLGHGNKPDNNIYPSEMGKEERARLKKAMLVTDRLQYLTSKTFMAGKI